MSTALQDLLDEILVLHTQEMEQIQQQVQLQMQQHMQGQMQQMQGHMQGQIQQMQQHMQNMQQHYTGEIEKLLAQVETLKKQAGTPSAASSAETVSGERSQAIELEIEIDVDGVFYVIELQVIPVSQVNLYEVMPGMVVPVDEAQWSGGRLVNSGGLEPEVYVEVEKVINEEVRGRVQRAFNS